MSKKKPTKEQIAQGTAVVLLVLGVVALLLYRAGYYEISFLDRPAETTAPEIGIETEAPSAETTTAQEVQTIPPPDGAQAPDEEKQAQEALLSMPTRSELLAQGYVLHTGSLVPGVDCLARVDHGTDYGPEYFSSRGDTVLSLYLGMLLYDNGSVLSVIAPDGHISAAGIDALQKAYCYDQEGHPLFLYQDKYYYLTDGTNEMIRVSPEEIEIPALSYNFAPEYGRSAYDLYPFEAEIQELHFYNLEGQDITQEVQNAIAAGYLIVDESLTVHSAIAAVEAVAYTLDIEETDASEGEETTLPDTEISPSEQSTAEETAADSDAESDGETTVEEETDAPSTDTQTTEESSAEETVESGEETTEEGEEDPAESESTSLAEDTTALPDETTASAEETTIPEETTELPEETTAPIEDTPVGDPWDIYHYPNPNEVTAVLETISRWGYRRADGTVILEPQYLFAAAFTENDRAVVLNAAGHMQVINTAGKTIVDPYGRALYLPGREDRAALAYDAPPDTTGVESAGMYYYDHGLLRVRRTYVDYYQKPEEIVDVEDLLIDRNGEIFSLPGGYHLVSYTEGMILLEKDGRYGFLDYTGAWVVQPIYTYAEPFSGGVAVVGFSGGKKGAIDREGNLVLPLAYNKIHGAVGGIVIAYSFEDGWTIYHTMRAQTPEQ